jgi:hypothetical protein
MSAHLGSWVSALVDGQLDGPTLERALEHTVGCPVCAQQVSDARAARRSLASELGDVRPAPDFMSRLLSLAEQVDGRQRNHGENDAQGDVTGTVVQGKTVQSTMQRDRVPATEYELLPPRWQALCGDVHSPMFVRWRRVIVAALLAACLVAATLFVLGARPVVVPARHTVDALSALATAAQLKESDALITQATVASNSPTGDSDDHEILDWMGAEGWPTIEALPEGVTVLGTRFSGSDSEVLEVDLSTPLGDVVFREQRGQLDAAKVSDLHTLTVHDAPVYVISGEPVHLVWQSSDTVIDLVTQVPLDDVLDLVSAFAVDEFDSSVQARFGRGWTTLTGVLS